MIYQNEKQLAAFEEAKTLIGLKEIPGPDDAPEIVKFFEEVGHAWVKDDETAWCASFVGAMLERAGLKGTGKLNARSYLEWEKSQAILIEDALPGDIVVFWRGKRNGWQGHVGFYVSHGASTIQVLGGNQGNQVSIQAYKRDRLLGIRRMPGDPPSKKRGNLLSMLIALIGGLTRGSRK